MPRHEFIDSLEQALHKRMPIHGDGLVHHGDRGVSKMGDRYLRKLPVTGATSALHSAGGHNDTPRIWAKEMQKAKPRLPYGFKTTAVALANKFARIAFAILRSGGEYDERPRQAQRAA